MSNISKYKAISLFSGAGGMDIGVEDAGFDILVQIEMDKHCCNTLRAAKEREKRKTEIVEGDIRNIEADELRKRLGLRKKELT